MRPHTALLLVPLLLLAACKTRPIPDYDVIRVPPGLSTDEVETALLLCIAGEQLGPALLTEDEALTADGIERLLRLQGLGTPAHRQRGWYLARRRSGSVEAEYRRGHHRLLMEFRFDDERVRPAIIDSAYLRQSGNEIHRNALPWAQELIDRVPGSLAWMARQARQTRTPPPPVAAPPEPEAAPQAEPAPAVGP